MNRLIRNAINKMLADNLININPYKVREYITLCPKDFDLVTYVNDTCETASYVDADGELVFVILIP